MTDGRHDFDFLFGRWTIDNERLARRLDGCTDWERFSAASVVHPLLGGFANVDTFVALAFPDGKPLSGATLRVFDPATRLWSLYWLDDRRFRMDPPVVGRWETPYHGVFYGDDTLRDRPVRVRYDWAVLDADHARWSQAFSPDGGATWEENWRMAMTRAG
ncbi:MAG: hypothetical protein ABMB14_31485 [Myxococcota bacterium]